MKPYDFFRPPRLYREYQVCAMLGITRTTLARWRREGHFPKPIRIGPKTNIWPKDVIDTWLHKRKHEGETENGDTVEKGES